MKISTKKTKVMSLKGNFPVSTKIITDADRVDILFELFKK
jgi:hypothetical protein